MFRQQSAQWQSHRLLRANTQRLSRKATYHPRHLLQMAAVLAHSIYRYTTGGYNAQEGVKQISPPKEGQSVMDKQVGAVLQQEPLLLSQTPFWWANPFQFFSLPVILLCAMIVFVIIRTVWAQNQRTRSKRQRYKISRKVQNLVDVAVYLERTVVRKSFIQKYAQEVVIVQSKYLKSAPLHTLFQLSTSVF